ncbi:hypothetical protein DFQ27_003662 [Actinomortierella ambigua]|uniref:Mid2 domain-containing protein n=1 Tax=Actinomortierella ambigua TaxID=1343610 RepID=A0A9P6Q432_9FUNG|nr:hypothetical protein DFQ27_003662 [Actinomortierella ambigua]
MGRTTFIFLLLACIADVGPDWLLLRRSLLTQVHARTAVISNPHDPSFFSKTPLAISDATSQGPGPQQHQTPEHLTTAQRRRLYRRTKLDPDPHVPNGIGIMQEQPTATGTGTNTGTSTLPSGSTIGPTSTATPKSITPSTSTAASGSTFISNVLQVPLLPSSQPEGGNNNDVNSQQNLQQQQQQNLPQPNQPPLPSSQDSHNPSSSRSSASQQQDGAATLSPPSLVILSIAIVAVVSLAVLGGAVAVRQTRRRRLGKKVRLECIEGGQGSIASQAHKAQEGSGRRSWAQWFSRQRKEDHYGLHSFNSTGSNSLPEQFWNPE